MCALLLSSLSMEVDETGLSVMSNVTAFIMWTRSPSVVPCMLEGGGGGRGIGGPTERERHWTHSIDMWERKRDKCVFDRTHCVDGQQPRLVRGLAQQPLE